MDELTRSSETDTLYAQLAEGVRNYRRRRRIKATLICMAGGLLVWAAVYVVSQWL